MAYSRLVAISVDPPEVNGAFRAGLGAPFPFLSDAERTVLTQLDLLEETDPKHRPFIPYVFMLYPDLTIHSIYCGYWFWGRPTVEELRQDFRAITRAIRPDFDPQQPASGPE